MNMRWYNLDKKLKVQIATENSEDEYDSDGELSSGGSSIYEDNALSSSEEEGEKKGIDNFIRSKTFLSPANLMGGEKNRGNNGGKTSPRRSSTSFNDGTVNKN